MEGYGRFQPRFEGLGEEMGDIGTNPRRIEVLPAKQPKRKPLPAPLTVKEPEKVPA